MPYIGQKERLALDQHDEFARERAQTPGQLNYQLTAMLHDYLTWAPGGKCYCTINEVIGVLECCKQEFYRIIAAPYEDVKRRENGGISDLEDLYDRINILVGNPGGTE